MLSDKWSTMLVPTAFKVTVQRKLTGLLSGINAKLRISSIVVGYFFYFYGFCPFKFKETLFRVLQHFRVAFKGTKPIKIF
jgi:hypothetical protein